MNDDVLDLALAQLMAEGDRTGALALVAAAEASASKMDDAAPVAGSVSAGGEVSVAGRDGRQLAAVIRSAVGHGARVFADVVGSAVSGYVGRGPLLDVPALHRLTEVLAAVNSTAELLGRVRVREMAGRAAAVEGLHRMREEVPFSSFADAPAGVIAAPEDAVRYFEGLTPRLGIDPGRFPGEQRRRAFTLAASANEVLTARVQRLIADGVRRGMGVADVTADVRSALDAAGVSPRNPQYAEMVFRTNAQDAYQTGVYEEGRVPEVRDVFPAWRYIGIDDERAGEDHRPKFGKLYPAAAAFAEVRGNRPFNCRCSLQWVDRWEWEDLESRGARLETRW